MHNHYVVAHTFIKHSLAWSRHKNLRHLNGVCPKAKPWGTSPNKITN